MRPKITKLNYTYKKETGDVFVLNTDDIPVNKELIKDTQIVNIGPGVIAGNHKHSRIEWFVALGDLVLIWIDEEGKQQETHMNPEGGLRLIEVPPYLPHAVVNRSKTEKGIIFEMASAKMIDKEDVKVI